MDAERLSIDPDTTFQAGSLTGAGSLLAERWADIPLERDRDGHATVELAKLDDGVYRCQFDGPLGATVLGIVVEGGKSVLETYSVAGVSEALAKYAPRFASKREMAETMAARAKFRRVLREGLRQAGETLGVATARELVADVVGKWEAEVWPEGVDKAAES